MNVRQILALGLLLLNFAAAASGDGVEALRKAAEQGDADAQVRLGLAYDRGNGVPKDDGEAVKWYRKAAEQGQARAQYRLGWMYSNGDGVAKDDGEAVKWFRKAAEQEDADAQFRLGWMYTRGVGVPEDDVQAYLWFDLAAASGDKYAGEKRQAIAKTMAPDQIAEAQRLAREWSQTHEK